MQCLKEKHPDAYLGTGLWSPHDDDLYRSAQCALVCLGAGYDHKIPGRYKKCIAAYLTAVVAMQKKDGSFSSYIQVHSRVAQSVCEAYAMTMDPQLKKPAQLAIDYLISQQIVKDGISYAWGTGLICDTDDSVHALAAIRAAKSSGLDVQDGYEGAKVWFRECLKHKRVGMHFPDFFNVAEMRGQGVDNMIGAMLAATLLNFRRGDEGIDQLLEASWETYFNEQQQWPIDIYKLHQLGSVLFQYGGQKWNSWSAVYRDLIVSQLSVSPLLHSKGAGTRAEALGDLYTTVEAEHMLEIYYRYDRYVGARKCKE